MGKKSKRPTNRNNQKTAALSLVSVQETFDRLFQSRDYEGALQLESQMIGIANTYASTHPSQACIVSYRLGFAHREAGGAGGTEQAIMHYAKAVELSKKGTKDSHRCTSVYGLARLYAQSGKPEKAMELHQSLCADIGKERIDPNALLMFNQLLREHNENSRSLEILEAHVDVIESSWDKTMQGPAYAMLASVLTAAKQDWTKSTLYFERLLPIAREIKDPGLESTALNGLSENFNTMGELGRANKDWTKANVYFERLLSITREMKNRKSESAVLNRLGSTYGQLGQFGIAMDYVEQELAIVSKMGDILQARAYRTLGDVLLAKGGHEKEAIEVYQKACGFLETTKDLSGLSVTNRRLSEAYRAIGSWDEAFAALQKSISIAESSSPEERVNPLAGLAYQVLGQTYLEQYCTDESQDRTPQQNDELMRNALSSSEKAVEHSSGGVPVDPGLLLDLAQEHYVLGDVECAHDKLSQYLDKIVKRGPSNCQTCDQTCAKDAFMEKCSVCKVARYCCEAHQLQSWQKGRLCHKVMCPLLQHWRKTKGTDNSESRDELFSDFFQKVLASNPK